MPPPPKKKKFDETRKKKESKNQGHGHDPVFERSFFHHKPKGQVTDKIKKPEKITQAETFFFAKAWAVWNFNMINLP